MEVHPIFAPSGGYVPPYLQTDNAYRRERRRGVDSLSYNARFSSDANHVNSLLPVGLRGGHGVTTMMDVCNSGFLLTNKSPLARRTFVLPTGTKTCVFELDPNDSGFYDRICYNIEKSLGAVGRIELKDARGNSLSGVSINDAWRSDPSTWAIEVHAELCQRDANQFTLAKPLPSDQRCARLELFAEQFMQNLSARTAAAIIADGKEDWCRNAAQYTDYRNSIPLVASSIVDPSLYDSTETAPEFLHSYGIVYPSLLASEISSRLSQVVQDTRDNFTPRSADDMQRQLSSHIEGMLSECGISKWLKTKWRKATRYARSRSNRYYDSRDRSSDSDDSDSDSAIVVAYTTSSSSTVAPFGHGPRIRRDAYGRVVVTRVDSSQSTHTTFIGNDSDSGSDSDASAAAAYYYATVGDMDQVSLESNFGSAPTSSMMAKEGDAEEEEVAVAAETPALGSRFKTLWTERRDVFESAFSPNEPVMLLWPCDSALKDQPADIHAFINAHSVILPARQCASMKLASLCGKNVFTIEDSLVNGEPAGDTCYMTDATRNYFVCVKPISFAASTCQDQ